MELTVKQQEGLKIAIDRYRHGDKYTVISGYAGTGKSTLVKFIIEALDVDKSKVAYATYTGKAAEVLRRKGNENAMTLHRLLYDSIPRQGGGFFRKPKLTLEYTIVVVDEVSMVPKSMIDMLLRHKAYVIFLGDPFQLPMIDKDENHTLLDTPHIFLDEVMRQAAESEIIRLTMDIRAGKPIEKIRGSEVQVFNKRELSTGMLKWADMIICATNATRHNMNDQMRTILGYSGTIQDGERVICKRNYWDECNSDGDALVNGSVGIVKNPIESFRRIPQFVKSDIYDLPIYIVDFIPDGSEEFKGIEVDKKYITKEEPVLDWRASYQLGKMKMRYGDMIPKQLTYGYAITGHSAQGSEWNNVLVIEERFPFDSKEHARWLYTSCTRAAEKLVLIKED